MVDLRKAWEKGFLEIQSSQQGSIHGYRQTGGRTEAITVSLRFLKKGVDIIKDIFWITSNFHTHMRVRFLL